MGLASAREVRGFLWARGAVGGGSRSRGPVGIGFDMEEEAVGFRGMVGLRGAVRGCVDVLGRRDTGARRGDAEMLRGLIDGESEVTEVEDMVDMD